MLKRFGVLAVLGLAACGGDGDGKVERGFEDRQAIVDFADKVVIPTYTLLAERSDDMVDAVAALKLDTSALNLTTAQEAWVDMRAPWEASEGFLFGPVSSFGYDPTLDSWPVNRTDLDAVLDGDDELTVSFVTSLNAEQKGFHTAEYLLFGAENDREAGELDARSLEYLEALASEMSNVAHALLSRWTEAQDGQPAYRDTFVTAGEAGNTAYPSLTAAAQEIVGGMSGICDEVANGKIAEPYDNHDPELVESQFSFNSLIDFANNMRSVQNAYLGSVPLAGTSGRGLTVYVAGKDAGLDARIKLEITAAIDAINAVPGPFSTAIQTPASYDDIEAAQEAVRTLQATLDESLLPLVLE